MSKANKELIKKLTIIGETSTDNWSVLRNVVGSMDMIKVIEKEWCDRFKQDNPDMYPMDLSEMKTWSTFQGCSSLRISLVDGALQCKATIWNGDMLNGDRDDKRFTATLELPTEMIRMFEDVICSRFRRYLYDAFRSYLADERQAWMDNFSETILKE